MTSTMESDTSKTSKDASDAKRLCAIEGMISFVLGLTSSLVFSY